jgi:hypothetical protein
MISVLGRKCDKSGSLWNLSEGGEGSSFYRREHTKESADKIRIALEKAWNENRHHDMTGENNPNAEGLHGERNGRAKLTDNDRRAIAREYVPGKKHGHNGNGKELSLKYGVNPGQIRRIAVNPKWIS